MNYIRRMLGYNNGERFTAGMFGPNKTVERVLVLSGGGIDSYAAAQLLISEYEVQHVTVLTFDYGQQTAAVEREMAARQAKEFAQHTPQTDYEALVVHMDFGVTALSPEGRATAAEINESVNDDYVPFRNGQFLTAAFAYAERHNYDTVVFGAVGAVNPDNSLPFVRSATEFARCGGRHRINVYTPFVLLTKAAVATLCEEMRFTDTLSNLTTSCFNSTEFLDIDSENNAVIQCGVCRSCTSLKQAFEFAGVKDPYVYAQE